jgi:hypothetical protein
MSWELTPFGPARVCSMRIRWVNERPHFACPNCRLYIKSGYLRAYWLLEHPGMVCRNEGKKSGWGL